jgi:hypothetical protein
VGIVAPHKMRPDVVQEAEGSSIMSNSNMMFPVIAVEPTTIGSSVTSLMMLSTTRIGPPRLEASRMMMPRERFVKSAVAAWDP